MELRRLDKDALPAFIDHLIGIYPVIGAKEKEPDKYVFDLLKRGSEFASDYISSLLPPKKAMNPPKETLLRFTMDGNAEPVVEAQDQILFGVRPCDLHAIQLLDRIFEEGHPDAYYQEKRARTWIVGFDCMDPCDDECFCIDVGTLEAESGFDLLLTDLGNEVAITIGSDRGKALLKGFEVKESGEYDWARLKAAREDRLKAFPRKFKTGVYNLPLLFRSAYKSPVWEENGKRCLGCGSCTIVCPTCYCFDVQDDIALDLRHGERARRWDSCQLDDFAKVAGGHNFRAEKADRVRHRLNRKFLYLMNKYREPACVGCGRCGRVCLAKIKPVNIVNDLVAESMKEA